MPVDGFVNLSVLALLAADLISLSVAGELPYSALPRCWRTFSRFDAPDGRPVFPRSTEDSIR